MVFSKSKLVIKGTKKSRKSKKVSKIPKRVASGAQPVAQPVTNMATPPYNSPPDKNVNSSPYGTPETPTPAHPRGQGKRNSESKIPISPRSTKSETVTVIHRSPMPTDPIPIPGSNPQIVRQKDTPIITSPASDSTIEENIAEAMATNQFESIDLDLPLSLQHHITIPTANMDIPLSGKGSDLTAISLSTSEPVANKGILAPPASPQLASSAMASPVVPDTAAESYASYTSFMYTPPRVPPTPSPPQEPTNSSPASPLPKANQSTPLLQNVRRPFTLKSQHTTGLTIPPGHYEYHTVTGTIILPIAPENPTSGSGYGTISTSNTDSTPSTRSSLRDTCRSSCGMKPSVLCAYLLIACSLVFLAFMSWGTIFSGETGHRNRVGSDVIGGNNVSYVGGGSVVRPLLHGNEIRDVVPVAEPFLPGAPSANTEKRDVTSGEADASTSVPPHLLDCFKPHHPHHSQCPDYQEPSHDPKLDSSKPIGMTIVRVAAFTLGYVILCMAVCVLVLTILAITNDFVCWLCRERVVKNVWSEKA